MHLWSEDTTPMRRTSTPLPLPAKNNSRCFIRHKEEIPQSHKKLQSNIVFLARLTRFTAADWTREERNDTFTCCCFSFLQSRSEVRDFYWTFHCTRRGCMNHGFRDCSASERKTSHTHTPPHGITTCAGWCDRASLWCGWWQQQKSSRVVAVLRGLTPAEPELARHMRIALLSHKTLNELSLLPFLHSQFH